LTFPILRRNPESFILNDAVGRCEVKDLFLKVDGIQNKEQALKWSINAALQRNKVYKSEDHYELREKLKEEWGKLLCEEAQAYKNPSEPISDKQHCAAIARIAGALSAEFNDILAEGRLRFGTSQKALNLFLKYLWALDEIQMPPHCPIDSVVLESAGIAGSWTRCDSAEEYLGWINAIRKRLTLTEWENSTWLRWRMSNSGL
jgi:hypothetical protein